ncbi:MAG: MFS transporter, partial [Thermoplasmata archaeon]
FRNRIFTLSAVSMLLNALARGAFTFILVFYLQGPPRYLSPFTAGLFLIPVSASIATFGPVSGWLSDRYGPRPFLIAGLVTSAVGFLWLATIGPDESFLGLTPPLILMGAGMGLFASPNRAQMMTAVPPARRGVASGIGTTLINTGATISLGLTLIVMSTVLPTSSIQQIFLGTVNPAVPFPSAAGFLDAIHLIFLISAVFLVVALIPWLRREKVVSPAPMPPEAGD